MAENKLADMSTEFAFQILKLTDGIKGHYSLSNQLERSGTSIGANIREAKYALLSTQLPYCAVSIPSVKKRLRALGICFIYAFLYIEALPFILIITTSKSVPGRERIFDLQHSLFAACFLSTFLYNSMKINLKFILFFAYLCDKMNI